MLKNQNNKQNFQSVLYINQYIWSESQILDIFYICVPCLNNIMYGIFNSNLNCSLSVK